MPELTLAEPRMLLLAALAALVAGFVRGFSGFGGPAILTLALTQFYAPLSVLTKVILIDAVANVKLLPSIRRDIDWRTAGLLSASSIAGAPLGFYILSVADPIAMKRAIAGLVAVCTVVLMTGWRFRRPPSRWVQIAGGVLGGVAMGAAYIALVIVIFVMAIPDRAAVNRANMVTWGFFLAIVLIGAHALAGNIDFGDIWGSAMVGVVYLLAVTAGARCFRGVGEQTFRRVVLCLLLVLSAVGLAT